MNKQADIKQLFKQAEKKHKITEDDLNKARALVVESQRPLQAVRLLKKERKEREINEEFMQQKDKIIEKAKELEQMRAATKEEQDRMIAEVTAKVQDLSNNGQKRKQEEDKLQREQQEIETKQRQIQDLQAKLGKKEQELENKKHAYEKHKIFSQFLEAVVQDTGGENEGFEGIEELQARFKSLKNENNNLMIKVSATIDSLVQKKQINEQMEEARTQEKKKLNELKETLYDRQREMQHIQATLEEISAKNSRLEQDFEKEINNKNQNSKEIGQIINSINNIALICATHAAQRGKGKKPVDKDTGVKEDTKDLVQKLVYSMQMAHQTVQELVQVHNQYGKDYDRDKAYAEDINFERQKEQKKHATSGSVKPQRTKQSFAGNDTGSISHTGATGNLGLGQTTRSRQ